MSLNHREYRGYLEIKDKLEKEFSQELNKSQDKEIREEIIKQRNEKQRRNSKGISR